MNHSSRYIHIYAHSLSCIYPERLEEGDLRKSQRDVAEVTREARTVGADQAYLVSREIPARVKRAKKGIRIR